MTPRRFGGERTRLLHVGLYVHTVATSMASFTADDPEP